jgi:hypothetical protein
VLQGVHFVVASVARAEVETLLPLVAVGKHL